MGFFDFIFPDGKSPQLTTAQAFAECQEGARLIDIRPLLDRNKGFAGGSEHIPQARLLRPDSGLSKDERLILLCADGETSLRVAASMKRAGFNAISVHGGLDSWRRSGLPYIDPRS
ncbi:rhodanese-like domain-containing protein [Arcanobacterium haemolyticum]|uniref:Rhodanese domain protein n=1 Tax=Arcanobacterium haemolyticum (strain ATCC 9345 / DSM 20595 / CCM 5947 / CCUG 17215 / LMG 16163 / NBRC 15585 / NCTC 8452 / 11018) TaxID=644284 RepID=D7BND4_ARCHD|nr:rhodanese-like domain-containing protein [Arcanobacterium haemolyticum]ADH92433.1 Rhodanese domain protein [Arcanobacterium haemolyticum DSM 20595]QCX46567.1 rhodanese-like domain-containing protein [Arcanobacterium haemolyticum]SQH28838.1 molybdopterin biosynthesis protein MoeB [Arcanobacterium haemolyticum]